MAAALGRGFRKHGVVRSRNVLWAAPCVWAAATFALFYSKRVHNTLYARWGNRFRTDIQRCVFLSREIVNVRDPQRLNGGLSDPSQDVSQEHVDPHGQVGLAFTPWRTRPVNKTLWIFTLGVVCFCAHANLCRALQASGLPGSNLLATPPDMEKGLLWSLPPTAQTSQTRSWWRTGAETQGSFHDKT